MEYQEPSGHQTQDWHWYFDFIERYAFSIFDQDVSLPYDIKLLIKNNKHIYRKNIK